MGLFKRHNDDELAKAFSAPETAAPQRELPSPPATDSHGRRSVMDQQRYLLKLVDPLPAFGMYLLDAWGTAVCEDIVAQNGVELLRKGQRLDARRTTILAKAGIDRVMARPRPRVIVVGVGEDENYDDSTTYLLSSLVKAAGAQVWRVSFAGGTDRELHDVISDQLIRSDLVITTGDLNDDSQLLRVVPAMGLVDVADLAMQPGGKLGFGLIGEDEIPMLMLPSDPVVAYAGHLLFGVPMINKLMGAQSLLPRFRQCFAGSDIDSPAGVTELRFVALRTQTDSLIGVPLGNSAGPKLTDLVNANGVLVLDGKTTHVALGGKAYYWPLTD